MKVNLFNPVNLLLFPKLGHFTPVKNGLAYIKNEYIYLKYSLLCIKRHYASESKQQVNPF